MSHLLPINKYFLCIYRRITVLRIIKRKTGDGIYILDAADAVYPARELSLVFFFPVFQGNHDLDIIQKNTIPEKIDNQI